MHHYRPHRDRRSSHQQITRIVRELARSPVLDVGAAQGMLGQNLDGSGLVLDAIEPNPAWADAARPFYRKVYIERIEHAPLPSNAYEVVVCGDVLEHVTDPAAALAKLRAAATDDAAFVVSLPNIAHVAIRLLLLFGAFPRMQRGILDRTHLHFFTRETATDLLRHAGLTPERVSATPVPLEEVWPAGEGGLLIRLLTTVQNVMLAVLPSLFAYQWIFVVRPVELRPSMHRDGNVGASGAAAARMVVA